MRSRGQIAGGPYAGDGTGQVAAGPYDGGDQKMSRVDLPPVPPAWLPPGRVELLPGRGEVFVRDSGPETDRRGTVLLLHGWTWSADINWVYAYRQLVDAGFRTVGLDHRGHGRGIRAVARFRLADAAADAAALVRQLELAPVIAAGYSMGGAIAQLMARDAPELLSGLVLAATSLTFTSFHHRLAWRLMGLFQFVLRLLPRAFWARLLRAFGAAEPARDAWILGELARGSAHDIAEAGRELGRFDSRSWAGSIGIPTAVVVPDRDRLVPPRLQLAIAAGIPGATVHMAPGDHGDVIMGTGPLIDALVAAVEDVASRPPLAKPAQAVSEPADGALDPVPGRQAG